MWLEQVLVEADADLDAPNDEGNNPLIMAAICMKDGAADCARLLVESNANPEIENNQERAFCIRRNCCPGNCVTELRGMGRGAGRCTTRAGKGTCRW